MHQLQKQFFITIVFLLVAVVALDTGRDAVSGNIVANQQVSLCSLDQDLNTRLLTNLRVVTSRINYIYNLQSAYVNQLWGITTTDSQPGFPLQTLFLYDIGTNGVMGDSTDDKVLIKVTAPLPNIYFTPLPVTGFPNPLNFYYIKKDLNSNQYTINSCPIQRCIAPYKELFLSSSTWDLNDFIQRPSAVGAFIMESKQRIYLAAKSRQTGDVHFMSCSLTPTSTDACILGENAFKTHYVLSRQQWPGTLVYNLPNVGFIYSFYGTGTSPSWLYFDALTESTSIQSPAQIANIQYLQAFNPAQNTMLVLNLVNKSPTSYTIDYSFYDPATGALTPFIASLTSNFLGLPHLFLDPADRLFGAVFVRDKLDANRNKIGMELVLRKVNKKENVLFITLGKNARFPLMHNLYHMSDRQIVSFIRNSIGIEQPVAVSCP